MRYSIIAVGKMRPSPEKDLFEHFACRLRPPPEMKEVEEKRSLSSNELKLREAELLLGAVPDGAQVVALDEVGKSLSSTEFSQRLGRWRDEGVRDVALLIGGANGLDDQVRQKADLVLSLGAMTWPHMVVRALVCEQLYRAEAILSGHPYHRA